MPTPQLTERDTAILDDLYRLRYMVGSQIERKYFTSTSARNRRLALLIERGYIKPFEIANVPERVFKLSPAGARVVAGGRGVELADLSLYQADRRTPSDHYFMRHHLAVGDFRLAMEERYGRDDERMGFMPEYARKPAAHGGLDSFIKGQVIHQGEPFTHTPDGVFRLYDRGQIVLYFLEVDRGTEVVSKLAKGVMKFVRFYALYLKSGRYKRFAREYPGNPETATMRVLIVVLNDNRARSIRETATGIAGSSSNVLDPFLITTLDRVLDDPGGEIWWSLNSKNSRQFSLSG